MDERMHGFFAAYPWYTDDERALISSAWDFMAAKKGTELRDGTEPFLEHPLRVASILAELNLDAESLTCALLHGTMDELGVDETSLAVKFGPAVAALVSGTSRVSALKTANKTLHGAETVRRMFFAMVADLRIIMIRLADRLDKMRHLKGLPEETQKAIAQETIDIWAPLANRLGISSIKDELEDLSLKYLNREVFDHIKAIVATKKGERAGLLERAESEIRNAAHAAGIRIGVKSRAKHFWSIYQKMKKRNKAADELYDLLAMRILCETPNECYAALGLVHTIWKPLEGRFKDYIAMPKANGYRSLHTTVMFYEGKPLEIQIRTHEMHRVAENGIASHWLYKKGSNRESLNEEHLPVINRLREASAEQFNDEDFLARVRSEILGDSIYVFTPKGDIIELPAGSTAIDFAYAIHTAVGEKIVGAKADGSIVPLSQALRNTQVVEVITHPQAHPTANQYNNAHTARARQKIRAWLQENEPASGFEKKDTHDGERASAQTVPHTGLTHRKGDGPQEPEEARQFDAAVLKIRVGDTTNFLIKFAACCAPTPPDPILGYVSRGRGIIIHRQGCPNLARIPEIANRSIPVEWEVPPEDRDKKKKK